MQTGDFLCRSSENQVVDSIAGLENVEEAAMIFSRSFALEHLFGHPHAKEKK